VEGQAERLRDPLALESTHNPTLERNYEQQRGQSANGIPPTVSPVHRGVADLFADVEEAADRNHEIKQAQKAKKHCGNTQEPKAMLGARPVALDKLGDMFEFQVEQEEAHEGTKTRRNPTYREAVSDWEALNQSSLTAGCSLPVKLDALGEELSRVEEEQQHVKGLLREEEEEVAEEEEEEKEEDGHRRTDGFKRVGRQSLKNVGGLLELEDNEDGEEEEEEEVGWKDAVEGDGYVDTYGSLFDSYRSARVAAVFAPLEVVRMLLMGWCSAVLVSEQQSTEQADTILSIHLLQFLLALFIWPSTSCFSTAVDLFGMLTDLVPLAIVAIPAPSCAEAMPLSTQLLMLAAAMLNTGGWAPSVASVYSAVDPYNV
jgi:hypothetical protein